MIMNDSLFVDVILQCSFEELLRNLSASENFATLRCSFGRYAGACLLATTRAARTWAMAVRRGSYKPLFLLNSGNFL